MNEEQMETFIGEVLKKKLTDEEFKKLASVVADEYFQATLLAKSEQVYYCYGSGMIGCLYDYGPHFCLDKDDAIGSFTQLFEDSIESDELIEMRANLREDGMHSFRNPHEAGAHYCQISEELGEMPENSDD